MHLYVCIYVCKYVCLSFSAHYLFCKYPSIIREIAPTAAHFFTNYFLKFFICIFFFGFVDLLPAKAHHPIDDDATLSPSTSKPTPPSESLEHCCCRWHYLCVNFTNCLFFQLHFNWFLTTLRLYMLTTGKHTYGKQIRIKGIKATTKMRLYACWLPKACKFERLQRNFTKK